VNKNKHIYICAFLVLLLISEKSVAQTVQCTEKLDQAQANFNIGNLPGIPTLLEGCINNKSFSPEESIRAHKLITMVYLYRDDQENADKWMTRLLLVDPEHKLDPATDPAEILYLKETFLYKPIFRLSLSLSGNRTSYNEFKGSRYGVGLVSVDNHSDTPGTGIAGLGTIEKEVYNGVDVGLGVGFSSRSFSLERDILYTGNTVTVSESQGWIEVPAFIKYTYYGDGEMKFSPYVVAGGVAGYMMSATMSDIQRLNENATANSTTVDLFGSKQRNNLNYFAFGGLGVKIRMKTHFLFFEAKYVLGITNVVNGDNRYHGPSSLYYNVGYVDSDFTLNSLVGSFGYQRSIYNPRKIKK